MKRAPAVQALALLALMSAASASQNADKPARAELTRDQLLKMKAERVLPAAMREHGLDCWLVFTRENARDPIASDIGGGSVVARAAFVFYFDKEGKFHRVAIVASYEADTPPASG